MQNVKHHDFILVAAIIVLALNLRPAMAAIGPLLDMIEAATGLHHTAASLLTTLPVLVMGLGVLAATRVSGWLGERHGVSLGISLIAAACAARYVLTSAAALLLSAALAGIGIALIQTLLPGLIKRRFGAAAGNVFALYTTAIMAGAALAAASAAELARFLDWPAALAVWALPALLALFLWQRVSSTGIQAELSLTAAPHMRFWGNRRAWELLLFFGIGTGAYTLVLAWLPPFYTALGWSPSAAGMLLGSLTLAEVMAGLAVSAWIAKFPDRRQPLLLVLCMLSGGLICLLTAPQQLAALACMLLGSGIGALFPLSLIVTLDHAGHPAQAGQLTAFVQGGGYLIASAMPLLAGILRDRFADLSQAWAVMLAGSVFLLGLCLRFSPASYYRIGQSATSS